MIKTCLIFFLLCALTFTQDCSSCKSLATRSDFIAHNGMTATNHPLVSPIGIEFLRQGSSAIHAANTSPGFADPDMNGINAYQNIM